MTIQFLFDTDGITHTEFGVGARSAEAAFQFAVIPVDGDVQRELCSSVKSSLAQIHSSEDEPHLFDPANKHPRFEYSFLPSEDEMAELICDLHNSDNLPINSIDIADATQIACYFAKFTDKNGRILTAVRQARFFKSLRKRKIIEMLNGELSLLDRPIFKLDPDFNVLMDDENLHILHPNEFSALANLKSLVLDAVAENVAVIQSGMPYVDFHPISEYAATRFRAASMLVSIRRNGLADNIDRDALREMCDSHDVSVGEYAGQLQIGSGHELRFLEILDRRRFNIALNPSAPENYRALNRRKVG